MRRETDRATPCWCLTGTLGLGHPKLPFLCLLSWPAVSSLSLLRKCQVHSSHASAPHLAVIQSAASAVGSAFKMHPKSDHSCHLCSATQSPSPSPHLELLLLVPNWSPSFHPCSLTVYSQYISQRIHVKHVTPLFKIPQGPPSHSVKVKVLKMTFGPHLI